MRTSGIAGEVTFGIEYECALPTSAFYDNCIEIGDYHSGRRLPWPLFPCPVFSQEGRLGGYWRCENDSSVCGFLGDMRPVEIVSPVLQGRDGLLDILQVAATIKSLGGRVNKTCGTHIHIGLTSAAGSTGKTKQAHFVANLLYQVARHEGALYASTGTHSRERGEFCRPVKSVDSSKELADKVRKDKNREAHYILQNYINGGYMPRYCCVNLSNVWTSRNTVEFRYPAGTLNLTKIAGHIQMILALVERARVYPTNDWDGVLGDTYKVWGKGSAWLDRFYNGFGWIQGKSSRIMRGVLEPLTIPDIRKKFNVMAKKYDSGNGEYGLEDNDEYADYDGCNVDDADDEENDNEEEGS